MQINEWPRYDISINTTGCCPKFDPEGWDRQDSHFRDKPMVRAVTMSAMHVPLNMGRVFGTILNFVLWRGNCSVRRPTYEHRQRPIGLTDGRPFARRSFR